MSFTPKIPIQLNEKEDFEYIESYIETLKQNFKILLFTNPGEKLFSPNFGVGIRKYLFEAESGFIGVRFEEDQKIFFLENFSEKLYKSLDEQCTRYMPDIKVDFVTVEPQGEKIYFKVKLTYANFITETVILNDLM